MLRYMTSAILTSAVMSAIALVFLAFNTLFPKAFPAKIRYAVWLVVLAGLIIPLRPVIGNGIVTVTIPATAQAQYEQFA